MQYIITIKNEKREKFLDLLEPYEKVLKITKTQIEATLKSVGEKIYQLRQAKRIYREASFNVDLPSTESVAKVLIKRDLKFGIGKYNCHLLASYFSEDGGSIPEVTIKTIQ